MRRPPALLNPLECPHLTLARAESKESAPAPNDEKPAEEETLFDFDGGSGGAA